MDIQATLDILDLVSQVLVVIREHQVFQDKMALRQHLVTLVLVVTQAQMGQADMFQEVLATLASLATQEPMAHQDIQV